MPNAELVQRNLLDPRPAAEADAAPIADAVNIPLAELPGRTHELPPRSAVIPVAGPRAVADQAVAWLTATRRRAVVCTDFQMLTERDATRLGRLWRPAEFLVDVLAHLRPGVALDLACGTGRDAIHMASGGWSVTAVDLLPDALDRGRELAARCSAALAEIRWQQADLEHEPPEFDRRFDLITVFRYLHRPLLPRLADWLNPGGSVVYETFTSVHAERYGKPAREAHRLRPNELPDLFDGFEIRHYSETWRGRAHTARIWARRRG